MKLSLPYFYLSALAIFLISGNLSGQCNNSIISNGGFESGASTDWWTWHDNSPDAYSFATSTDALTGNSSAVINVLVDTDDITGTQGGEYNSRPQTNPVVNGEVYEIRFFAKSTLANTDISFFLKDEFDGFVQLHSDVATVGTDWTEIISTWTADADRADIHLEIKVYNAGFNDPYSLLIDDVSICSAAVLSNTCADNLVANPGFENGASVNWWTWHGGTVSDYAFSTGMEGYVGIASAQISVLKPGADLNGFGEYNNRPQVSPVAAGQNYKVSFWSKSTLANTELQVYVKDEFDNFINLGNADFVVGTEWTESSFVFANETARGDVHIEIKATSTDFPSAYDILIDEVSICETTEDATLPLTLVAFKATTENKLVRLEWNTENELNTNFFTIEKTQDGRNFSFVGEAQAAGQTDQGEQLHYEMNDDQPSFGTSYYRLKTTDFDGHISLSQLVEVKVTDLRDWDFELYPNPNTGQFLSIRPIGLDDGENIKLEIMNVQGEILRTESVLNAGNTPHRFDLKNRLPAGSYLIRLITEGGLVWTKMLVVGS